MIQPRKTGHLGNGLQKAGIHDAGVARSIRLNLDLIASAVGASDAPVGHPTCLLGQA
jgi:hypothetical protein